jgi:hypothetical protein
MIYQVVRIPFRKQPNLSESELTEFENCRNKNGLTFLYSFYHNREYSELRNQRMINQFQTTTIRLLEKPLYSHYKHDKEYSELPKSTNYLIRSCQPIRKGHITNSFFS